MQGARQRTSKNSLFVVRSTPDVVITAKLFEYGMQLSQSLALVHRRGEESFVDMACPSHGAYTLRLFATRESNNSDAEAVLPTWICDYTLDVDPPPQGLIQGRVGYSEVMPPARGKRVYLRSPQQINLESINSHWFDVEVPGATHIAIGSARTWIDLHAEFGEEGDAWGVEGRFRGMVYLPHSGDFFMYVSMDNEPFVPFMRFVGL